MFTREKEKKRKEKEEEEEDQCCFVVRWPFFCSLFLLIIVVLILWRQMNIFLFSFDSLQNEKDKIVKPMNRWSSTQISLATRDQFEWVHKVVFFLLNLRLSLSWDTDKTPNVWTLTRKSIDQCEAKNICSNFQLTRDRLENSNWSFSVKPCLKNDEIENSKKKKKSTNSFFLNDILKELVEQPKDSTFSPRRSIRFHVLNFSIYPLWFESLFNMSKSKNERIHQQYFALEKLHSS